MVFGRLRWARYSRASTSMTLITRMSKPHAPPAMVFGCLRWARYSRASTSMILITRMFKPHAPPAMVFGCLRWARYTGLTLTLHHSKESSHMPHLLWCLAASGGPGTAGLSFNDTSTTLRTRIFKPHAPPAMVFGRLRWARYSRRSPTQFRMPREPRACSELLAFITITAVSPPMLSTSKSCAHVQKRETERERVCVGVCAHFVCVRA